MSDTTATMKAVLERINELGEQLGAEIQSVHSELKAEIQSVHSELKDFRSEASANFRQLQRQFDYLAGEFARLHVVQGEIEERISRLEEQRR